MDMTDEQLDEMLLDKRLEESRARELTPATEPAGEDNAPIQIPYKPGRQPVKEASDRSYLESFGRGAAQGYFSGFPDEITGAAESAVTGKDYKTARDESRKAYKESENTNPVTYNVGMFGGAVGQALTPGVNLAGKGGAALQGGISALGFSEAEKPEDMAVDTAIGVGTGAATGYLFDKAANLKKYLSNVAEQRAYKAAAGQSKKDIMAEKKAGRITVDREGISMARGRDLLSKDEAGKPAVSWFDRTESIAPKVIEKRKFFGKAIGDIGAKIDEAIPEGPVSYDEIAEIINREMANRPKTLENNKLNKRLQNQLNYAQGQGYINSNKYTGDSVLSGQNAISGFGTNDYLGQLNKNLNRLESYKNPNNKTFEMIEKTKKQIDDFELAEVKKELATETTTNNGGGGGGFDTSKSGGEGAFGSYDGSRGRKDYNDGGITNVNMNRGKPGEVLSKLGELLYG